MHVRKLFSVILISIVLLLLNSCDGSGGGADSDCSCDEIVKKDGKYYRTGAYKDGDRVSFGELFTGTCATLNGAGEVIEKGEYNNGFILANQQWLEVDGELFQVLDMTYNNNKKKDGYKLVIERTQGFLCPIEYNEYKGGQDVSHYSMLNGYGKTIVSGDLGEGFFESNCMMEGYDINPSKMHSFLTCIKKENLPKFFIKDYNLSQNYSSPVSSKAKNDAIQAVNDNFENGAVNTEPVKEKELYSINDPDGYSNLRRDPGGEIIKKVYDTEKFEVIGEKDKHKKVKLSDGTIGYIHNSRVVKN